MFTKIIVDTVINSLNFELQNLKSSQRYYWKVSAINNDQEGLLSKYSNFKTKEIINVEEFDVHKEIILYGNFPNPFDESSDLRFFIKGSRKITVDLFNVAGRKIKTLFEGHFTQGEHSVKIPGNGLSQGDYFLIFKSDDIKILKKITIIK